MAKVLPVALWIAADATDRTRTIGLMNPGDFIATTGGTIEVMLTNGTLLAAGGSYTLPAATTAALGGVKQATAFTNMVDGSGGTLGGGLVPTTDFTTANNNIFYLYFNLNAVIQKLKTSGVMS
jgi:Head fiber protein